MIHPENADEAVDRILMLIGDLGVEAEVVAVSAPTELPGRLRRLRQLGLDQAVLAAAGEAILRNRALSVG